MSHSIDAHIIDKLLPYLITDYEKLSYVQKPGLKEAFISGDIQEFSLTYSDPSQIDYADAFYMLEKIGEEVLKSEAVICRAYLPKLQEVKDRYTLLHATSRGDDTTFFEQSAIIYGLPKMQYYRYAIRGLHAMLENIKKFDLSDARVVKAIVDLEPLVTENVPTSWDSITLPPLVSVTDNHVLSAPEIKQACEDAFLQYGVFGWQAIIAQPGERITFNVNQDKKVLCIPHNEDIKHRKYPLTKVRVDALIAHEIGTHIVRRQNGEQSPLSLLGTGLSGYLNGEEGIATYREQCVRGATQFSGSLGYLGISWVVGLDGTPRSFRGLYVIMVPYLFLSVIEQTFMSQLSLDLDMIEENVKRNAWARCVRIFRGVTGMSPGHCFTRDIIYLEGNIGIWQLLEADPSFEQNFSIGKYDPTNKEHVSILHELGLLR